MVTGMGPEFWAERAASNVHDLSPAEEAVGWHCRLASAESGAVQGRALGLGYPHGEIQTRQALSRARRPS